MKEGAVLFHSGIVTYVNRSFGFYYRLAYECYFRLLQAEKKELQCVLPSHNTEGVHQNAVLSSGHFRVR